ncbi:FHA domain-containing protein [Microbacterium gilvum]|uniref:FHA domain-containing protein n=1 Tax=Microbacterium gilvum TaxID=1336204 RepID=A0ABP9A144_9MICO
MASARCAYCAATLEPSSMYCLGCGQLILAARDGADAPDDGWAVAPKPRAGAGGAQAGGASAGGAAAGAVPAGAVPAAGYAGASAAAPGNAVPAPGHPEAPAAVRGDAVPGDAGPGGAGPSAPLSRAAARSRTTWGERVRLRFSTGEDVVIAGDAVVGRKPEQTAATLGAQAVEIADATRSMSRVHLYLHLDERGALRAADAGSGNGSSVLRGERTIPLPADGDRFDLQPGDVVRIGDVLATPTPA